VFGAGWTGTGIAGLLGSMGVVPGEGFGMVGGVRGGGNSMGELPEPAGLSTVGFAGGVGSEAVASGFCFSIGRTVSCSMAGVVGLAVSVGTGAGVGGLVADGGTSSGPGGGGGNGAWLQLASAGVRTTSIAADQFRKQVKTRLCDSFRMISLLIRDMWSVHSPVYRQVVSLRATNAAVSASRSFDFPKGQTDFAAPVGREACLDMPGIVQKNAVLPSPVSRRIARTARASVGASPAFRQSSKLQEKFRIRHKPFGCDEQKAHRELSRLAPTARLNSAGD
jgi:hypothetical protein